MLVLTRKVGEVIRIDDNISVAIQEIREGRVKLGVVAPRAVTVHREEVYHQIGADAPHEFKAQHEKTHMCDRCNLHQAHQIHAKGGAGRAA